METNQQITDRTFTRRNFIRAASVAGILAARDGHAGNTENMRAAVIGHTGRGDYGHGWEGIFAKRSSIELVALVDPDPSGRAKTASKIGAPRQYADHREMLAKEKPKLVSLAMRHSDQHHPIALDVLRAGAHLWCEKPFTTTPGEADELLAEASKRGLKIAVAHTLRMNPSIMGLKQAMAEGIIGDLVEMRAFGKQDTRAGGEDMMVLGSHLFDLLRMFAGDPLSCTARVLSQGRDITRSDGRLVKDNVGLVAGDSIFAQFAFAHGINSTFTSTSKLRETTGNWGIEFYGTKGAARINCDVAPSVFIRKASAWKPEGKTDLWAPFDAAQMKTNPAPNLWPVNDWLEAIENNREPMCSGRNGAWAVEMALGVYHAAITHQQVPFPLADRNHPLSMQG